MKRQARPCRARGFTLVEFMVLLVMLVLLVAIVLPAIGGRRHHGGARQIKDSANIRGIHQGMVLFAQNNNDKYPLPSVLDKANNTLALAEGADPTTKDTTSNIISLMIYGTFFGPEICISPAESNGAITMFNGYQYAAPTGTPDPKLALWDPAFNADFTAPKGGHFSYAHALPSGPRLEVWANTFLATEAVLGNRGPLISGLDAKHNAAFNAKSNTLLIHGSRTAWEGNIAYNDNHVSYESRLDPETCPYTDAKGKVWFDHLFFDETDDTTGKNNFLGNFNQAGPAPQAFKTIWD